MKVQISGVANALAVGMVIIAFRSGMAQGPAPLACTLPTPSFVTGEANIFNDRQEQDLGDALAEFSETELRMAPLPANASGDLLTRLGEKLLATLPPTGVHYSFRIYDSGEVNGFSLAGGRVYISRKLIAAVKNEDELAGVLAHEIGHLSTHQTAIEFTRILRIRLGVTQVTDRADIFARVHQLMSTAPKPREEQDTEKADQLAADRVALYAMVRAGYAPESFASFLNDISMNKGKTGNWLSDAFGITHEASQRYRSALKLISVLPGGCKGSQPTSNADFAAWQRSVVEDRVKAVAEAAPGDRPLKLDAPIRPSLWRIRFSPDGRYILAQDEAGISVVDRISAKVKFQIDAPEVNGAEFTPDSANVVFDDDKLRVEKWSVATGERISVKELVVYDGCSQVMLAPDGTTLVCLSLKSNDSSPRVGLRLIDVESGKAIYDKPGFFAPGEISQPGAFLRLEWDALTGSNFAAMDISPDGRYLIVAVMNQVLAYDLEHRRPIELGGKLRGLTQTRLTFMGEDELYVVGDPKGKEIYKASELSFPDGKLLKESEIGGGTVYSVTKGHFLKTGPLRDLEVGILDPADMKFKAGSKTSAIDVWDPYVAIESPQGGLQLGQIGVAATQQVALPTSELPVPRAAVFSPDGKYLAVSLKQRGSLWDLDTNKQIILMRPFRSAWMGNDDRLFAQLSKFRDQDPADLVARMSPPGAKSLGKYEADEWQYRDLQFHFKPMGKEKITTHHATLEVKKMETQAVAWTRDYPHETPACWPAEDDRMVLGFDLSSETAKAEVKNFPALQSEVAALGSKKKGLLLETVNSETGSPLEQVIVPEADLSQGWNDARRATVSGEVVLARGEHGNTVIYRFKDGAKVGEFFGTAVATDARTGFIAAVNREDEVLLVDELTGQERQRFRFGSPVRLTRIVSGNGGALLVLTADQVVHRLPLPQ